MKRFLLMTVLCVSAVVAQEHEAKKEHAGAEGGEHASTEHAEPSLLWKWANFALLAGVLGWLVSKHAGPFFASRNQEITSGLVEARRLREESEARVRDIEARVSNLENEMANLRTNAKAEMAAEAGRILQETARLVTKIQDRGAQEIEAAAKQARSELKHYSAELAVDLAKQQVRARLSPEKQEGLVSDFVKELANERKGANN